MFNGQIHYKSSFSVAMLSIVVYDQLFGTIKCCTLLILDTNQIVLGHSIFRQPLNIKIIRSQHCCRKVGRFGPFGSIPALYYKVRTPSEVFVGLYIYIYLSGWWFGTCFSPHILGMSSSQLTNSIIFQRGRYTTNQIYIYIYIYIRI